MEQQSELRIPALEIRQSENRRLYSFAVDGKLLPRFTTVSRVRRENGGEIQGYQRPEVLSHISEIRNYLESEDPMIPNALVVSFDQRVRSEPTKENGNNGDGYSQHGTLVIPLDEHQADADKPGWVVDGQQRMAAIRDARIDSFPICVTAFIAGSDREQREQFILVNSTKPLPKGLIYELLPTTDTLLPSLLQRRRFPAYLMQRLNHDPDSPLFEMIKTPTNGDGKIKDNSVLKMLENSLTDGVLYRYRDPNTGKGDVEAMLGVVHDFWSAAKSTFKEAWDLPPRRSRLMHGAGIVSMGFLMDAIADRHRTSGVPTSEQFRADLEPLKAVCCWTNGHWDLGPGNQRKWNEIQNIHRDVNLLSNYLLVQYKALVWNRERSETLVS